LRVGGESSGAMRDFGGARAPWLGVLAVVVALPFGCSERDALHGIAGKGGTAGLGGRSGGGGTSAGKAGGGNMSGSGGRSAGGRGGATGAGGSGAASGEAGTGSDGAPDAGTGGRGTGGSTSGAGEGGAGGASSCEELVAMATLVPSTVTLLVDNSSSMFQTEPSAWTPLYQALMDPTFGAVKALEEKIRFGFASYRGSVVPRTEDDPLCADWTTVPAALDNHAAIDAAYGPIEWPVDQPRWETPTGHAIREATEAIVADASPGQKVILLITDGNPNTCEVLDPECGQDNSIDATQGAFEAGIRLFVVGIGDIVTQPNTGCPLSARCGTLHLQDLANAGRGAPVRPPPGCDDPTSAECQFKYEQCNRGQMLRASYTPNAPDAVAPLLLDTSTSPTPASLAVAITGELGEAVSCTFELDVTVSGDPTESMVLVGGTAATLGAIPGGFTLDANDHTLTLTGTACGAFRNGAPLSITFGCDPATGVPVAERR
jgi:hypothetical protein